MGTSVGKIIACEELLIAWVQRALKRYISSNRSILASLELLAVGVAGICGNRYGRCRSKGIVTPVAASGRGCVKTFFSAIGTQNWTGKSRLYAKSTSADVPINFRFNVDTCTSIVAKRFYTLWADFCLSPTSVVGRHESVAVGGSLPILLIKSDVVFTAEKYAHEIEILNRRTGIRTKISRSSVQKRRFHRSVFWQFEKTDFFNRIYRYRSVMKGRSSEHGNIPALS